MSIIRTIDHEEIRGWIEKHGGRPAIIAGETDDEGGGVLTLTFGVMGPETRLISWQEFFTIFDSQHLQFRYDHPLEADQEPGWAYSFEDQTPRVDSDETELPDEVDDVDENIFPSSPK